MFVPRFPMKPTFFAAKQTNLALHTVRIQQKEKTFGFLFAHLDNNLENCYN